MYLHYSSSQVQFAMVTVCALWAKTNNVLVGFRYFPVLSQLKPQSHSFILNTFIKENSKIAEDCIFDKHYSDWVK